MGKGSPERWIMCPACARIVRIVPGTTGRNQCPWCGVNVDEKREKFDPETYNARRRK